MVLRARLHSAKRVLSSLSRTQTVEDLNRTINKLVTKQANKKKTKAYSSRGDLVEERDDRADKFDRPDFGDFKAFVFYKLIQIYCFNSLKVYYQFYERDLHFCDSSSSESVNPDLLRLIALVLACAAKSLDFSFRI